MKDKIFLLKVHEFGCDFEVDFPRVIGEKTLGKNTLWEPGENVD